MYKNALRRNDTTNMDFYTFLDAVEQLATKIYKKEEFSESIENFLNDAVSYFES